MSIETSEETHFLTDPVVPRETEAEAHSILDLCSPRVKQKLDQSDFDQDTQIARFESIKAQIEEELIKIKAKVIEFIDIFIFDLGKNRYRIHVIVKIESTAKQEYFKADFNIHNRYDSERLSAHMDLMYFYD